MAVELASAALLVGWAGAAAWLDLRSRRLPNLLTLSGLGAALALRALMGPAALAAGLAGAGLCFLVVLPLFAIGALGGGDGKLMLGVGAFLGPERLLFALVVTGLVGGVMAAGAMVRARAVRGTLLNVYTMLAARVGPAAGPQERLSVPYGVAIACGAIAGWFLG